MKRVVVLFCAVALCPSLFACTARKSESAPKPAALALAPLVVEAVPVEVRAMPRVLTLPGNVIAERQSEVAANASGRVVSAPIERGQMVKVGEILVTVDSRAAGFSAAASSAQAQLADAQSLQAQEECARADRLHAQGAMAQSEYDRQKSQCRTQQFQANAARAQAGLNSKLAADAVIRAPFSGAVGERYVNVGEYLQPSTKVASVYVLDPVRVSISVPEPAIGLVRVGQTLELQVSAWPERTFPAVVEYVSPALRRETRDLILEARAENPDAALRPGMFATVLLTVGEERLPTVPLDSLVVDGTIKRIFLAREGRAFELVVQTGAIKDGRIAVLESLDEQTRVIQRPPPGLRDGASIKLKEAASAESASPARDALPSAKRAQN
jgi:membrane fusion protein (multidrug efflux system)